MRTVEYSHYFAAKGHIQVKSKILIVILCLFLLLTSCSRNQPDTLVQSEDDTVENEIKYVSELHRTEEYLTSDEIEEIKSQAVNSQSAQVGIGGFADIIVTEESDKADMNVFVSVDYKSTYEIMEITASDGVEAVIISAWSGAGSGEIFYAYKLFSEDSEWVEIFYIYYSTDNTTQPENVTEAYTETAERLNEMSPDEWQFK